MRHRRFSIPGPAGRLQAIFAEGDPRRPAAVVCHPHPQYGGTMRNKVVYWIARTFEEAGLSVLRFNFRGVEESEGAWDGGEGESRDAAAALDWLREHRSDSPLWLAGFSFGSYAGLKAARRDPRVARMFAVAPAVNHWSFDFMAGEQRPLSVVTGTADEIVPFAAVAGWVKTLEHARFEAIEGAGHFFPRHMDRMRRALVRGAPL